MRKYILLLLSFSYLISYATIEIIKPLSSRYVHQILGNLDNEKYKYLGELDMQRDNSGNISLVNNGDSYYFYQLHNDLYAIVMQSGGSGAYSSIIDTFSMHNNKIIFNSFNTHVMKQYKLDTPATSCVNWFCTLESNPFIIENSKVIIRYNNPGTTKVCNFELNKNGYSLTNLSKANGCNI